MPRRRAWFGIATSVLALIYAGVSCASSQSNALREPRVATTLHVKNNHWADVTVYMVGDQAAASLGVVPSMRDRTFVLPNASLGSGGQLRLGAEAFASRERHTSEIFRAVPGSRIEWSIEQRMTYSNLVIR